MTTPIHPQQSIEARRLAMAREFVVAHRAELPEAFVAAFLPILHVTTPPRRPEATREAEQER